MPVNSAPRDRAIIRDLAKQVAEIAALPVQQETIALWKALNARKPIRPMVRIDQVCWHEMNVDDELTPRCQDSFCRGLESQLRRTLYAWRHMRADMVVAPYVELPKAIHNTGFGLDVQERRLAADPRNTVVSHAYFDQLQTPDDLEKIRMPEVWHDEAATAQTEERARELLDGILDVRMQGACPAYAPLDLITCWRGAEPLLWDLVDRPEFVHAILQRVTEGQLHFLDQLEAQGLLGRDQQTIHCTGAHTNELPAPGFNPNHPRARDLWTFGMSQIFSTVSPAMHEEFERPYLTPWFERFGLGYYGCCEPLDQKLPLIRKYPRVRKVSMSPWADIERGASEIGGDFVLSRKPNPAFLAAETWDPAAVERDLRETRDACARHNCPLEFILKDISTVRYQPQRLWEWSEIAMRVAGA